jgi:hypothetical protein
MKKSNKIKYLVLLIFLAFIKTNVRAISVGSYASVYMDNTISSYVSNQYGTFGIHKYKASVGGKTYEAYCLDPGLQYNSSLKVVGDLSNGASDAKTNAFYKGMLQILKEGYHNNQTSTSMNTYNSLTKGYSDITISGDQYWSATSIALRIFTDAMGIGQGDAYYNSINISHATTAIFWSGYSSFNADGTANATNFDTWYKAFYGKDYAGTNTNSKSNPYEMTYNVVGPAVYSHLGGAFSSKISRLQYDFKTYKFNSAGNNNVYDVAYQLFQDGLKTAAASYDGGEAQSSTTGTKNENEQDKEMSEVTFKLLSKGTIQKENTQENTDSNNSSDEQTSSESENNNETYTVDDIYLLDMSSLDSSKIDFSKIHIQNFQIQSTASQYIQLLYSTDSESYQPLSSALDMVTLRGTTDKIYIKVHFEATLGNVDEDDDSVCDYPYTLSFEKTGYSQGEGFITSTGAALESPTQRYAFFAGVIVDSKETKTGDSSNMVKQSVSGDIDICKIFCASKIKVVKDCTELGDADMWNDNWLENDTSSNDNTTAGSITASDKITKCILNKTDDADNSYHLIEENGGVSSDNPYCQVYCKEDYALLKFSGIKTTSSGRYFRIRGLINSTKSCYTDSASDPITLFKHSIDREKYASNMMDLQKDYVEDYSTYWNAKLALEKAQSGGIVHSTQTGCDGTTVDIYTLERVPFAGFQIEREASNTDHYGEPAIQGKEFGVGGFKSGSMECTHALDPDSKTYVCTGCTSVEGSEGEIISAIEEIMNTALAGYTQDYNAMKEKEKLYNDCSTSWDNIYDENYEPDVYYKYHDNFTDLYSDSKAHIMDKTSETSAADKKYCNGKLSDNKYNCSVDTTSDVDYHETHYAFCKEGICSTLLEVTPISSARYISSKVDKKMQFTTPVEYQFYNVYSSGTVSIENIEESPIGEKSEIQTSTITGLPVSIRTVKGVYTFTFSVDKLGQFYDQGSYDNPTLGRVSTKEEDKKDKSVVGVLTKGQTNMMLFDGDYICYYTVNCPECTPVCTKPNGEPCDWCIGDDCPCTPGVDCPCPTCSTTCVNCVYDLSQLQLNFRAISSTNINPNNRSLGYNWNANATEWNETRGGKVVTDYTLIGQKAAETIESIQEAGDSVYDQTPILTVNMTPSLAAKIRDYNSQEESNGGYSNDSLTCYNYLDSSGNTLYPNIFCFSEFFDKYLESNVSNYSNAIQFVDARDRVSGAGRSDSNVTTEAKTSDGYWTVYLYSVTTDMGLGEPGVYGGPSWK